MSKAIVCDRCGKAVIGNETTYRINALKRLKASSSAMTGQFEKDFCKECFSELRKLMDNKEVKKNDEEEGH